MCPLRVLVLSCAAASFACGSPTAADTAGDSGSSNANETHATGTDSASTGLADTSAGATSVDASTAGGESGPGGACPPSPACDPTPGAGPTKVELRVYDVDDEVIATVDGLRRGFWSIPTLVDGDSGRIDITHWFARGQSQLRILAANAAGPAGVGVQVWVDDALVLDTACGDCTPDLDFPPGVFFDESVDIASEAFACPQRVCIHGEEDGSVYIDGTFTGAQSPIEAILPPGTYDFAIGSGTDDPPADAGPDFVHEGRFRERTVVVDDVAVGVELGPDDLAGTKTYDFLVVPIRNVEYTNGQVGVLDDEVPGVLGDAIDYASANMVAPFSYGLVGYTANVHPVLETTVTADADGFVAIDVGALTSAGLDPAAFDAADVVVWAYSAHLADGTPVDVQPCCAWGGGSQIWMHTGWVYEPPIVYYVFIHEWLHTTEDELILLGYSGADGVHGADEHGYMSGSNGEYDFAQFYRHFIRGQVIEEGTYVGAVMGLWQ